MTGWDEVVDHGFISVLHGRRIINLIIRHLCGFSRKLKVKPVETEIETETYSQQLRYKPGSCQYVV